MRLYTISSLLIFLYLISFFAGCEIIGSKNADAFTIMPNEVSVLEKEDHSVTFHFKPGLCIRIVEWGAGILNLGEYSVHPGPSFDWQGDFQDGSVSMSGGPGS